MLEWIAYSNLEPFGEYRADLRTGIVSAVLAQIHGKRGRRYKPEEFVVVKPVKRRQRGARTVSEMSAVFDQLVAMGVGQWQKPKSDR